MVFLALQFVTDILGKIADALPQWVIDRKSQLALDATAASAAIMGALLLRFEFEPSRFVGSYILWLPVIAVLRPILLLTVGNYRSTWRHFHLTDGLNLAGHSAVLTVGLLAFRALHSLGLPIRPLPFGVSIIELSLFVAFAGALRILRRLSYSAKHSLDAPGQRALIISDNGSVLGAVRLVEPYRDVVLVGILTSDSSMHGHTVAGIPVVGDLISLQQAIVTSRAELILMTSGGVYSAEEVIALAGEFGLQVRIIPTARDLVRQRVRVSNSLQIDQVINKFQPLNLEPHPAVVSCLHERCVLVTGAGGSIGSEISRQVAFLPVSKLILLDQDENSIFELINELQCTCAEIVPCVGDIRDAGMLDELFAIHKPDVILHAAAYKHVPVMEANACEAVLNNVTGTRQLVEAAERHDCERFVMISTDKAVHPSSVMGATKRTAEIVVQHRELFSRHRARTQFACVRFGNVVGSRGSVVPIFLRQIAAGGPITITHEEMTRYFMTIPQAVHLVLQAATLASTGDVYMLDMGDPVKIIEFARDLVRMSGLRPDIDIPIQITGTRPGEKLHEQLWYEDAEVSNTDFPSVFHVKSRSAPFDIASQVSRLEKAASHRASNEQICDLLWSLPLEYQRKLQIIPSASASASDQRLTAVSGDD
ncbi:MAG TPA: nucleoside-diphosphate sugar epimerase/dehydratase [Blattabacteriaceae bacterium]|nr:nucleoside-diphosphate sugar epimerase/dehydratase [Blattabacteriaceae bacterium]